MGDHDIWVLPSLGLGPPWIAALPMLQHFGIMGTLIQPILWFLILFIFGKPFLWLCKWSVLWLAQRKIWVCWTCTASSRGGAPLWIIRASWSLCSGSVLLKNKSFRDRGFNSLLMHSTNVIWIQELHEYWYWWNKMMFLTIRARYEWLVFNAVVVKTAAHVLIRL